MRQKLEFYSLEGCVVGLFLVILQADLFKGNRWLNH